MGKKLLIGLGIAGAAIYAGKKISEKYTKKISSKLDDVVAEGQETALKYREYLLDYLEEDDKLEKLNQKINQAKELVDKDSVTDALNNLKESIIELKSELSKEEFENQEENLQDDIIIDHRSAFSEAKEKNEKENPTIVFYPDGTIKEK